MQIDGFPKHIFWSYKPDADLPEDIIAKHVLLYGDIQDMTLLKENVFLNRLNDFLKKEIELLLSSIYLKRYI